MLDKLKTMQDNFNRLADEHADIAKIWRARKKSDGDIAAYHEGKMNAYISCANEVERLINEQSAKQAC